MSTAPPYKSKESKEPLLTCQSTAPPYKSKESKEPLLTCEQNLLTNQKNQKSPFIHVNSTPLQVKSIKRAPSYRSTEPPYKSKESKEPLLTCQSTAPPYKSKESKEPLLTRKQNPLPGQKHQKGPFVHVNSAPLQIKSIKRAPSYMSMPKKPEYKCV